MSANQKTSTSSAFDRLPSEGETRVENALVYALDEEYGCNLWEATVQSTRLTPEQCRVVAKRLAAAADLSVTLLAVGNRVLAALNWLDNEPGRSTILNARRELEDALAALQNEGL